MTWTGSRFSGKLCQLLSQTVAKSQCVFGKESFTSPFRFFFRFVEGMLNMCYNAIDRHIESGKGDKVAIIYDSPVTDTKATITYKEVLEQVTACAFCA